MRSKFPYKDKYDSAPYDALATTQAEGRNIRLEVAELIFHTRTRPGFMATRLNNAHLSTPYGGAWDWTLVREEKEWFEREQAKKGKFLRPVPAPHIGPSGYWQPRNWR